jgi:hypothetical protein
MHDLLSYLRERLSRIGAGNRADSGPRLELPPDRALDERRPAAALSESINLEEESVRLRHALDLHRAQTGGGGNWPF